MSIKYDFIQLLMDIRKYFFNPEAARVALTIEMDKKLHLLTVLDSVLDVVMEKLLNTII